LNLCEEQLCLACHPFLRLETRWFGYFLRTRVSAIQFEKLFLREIYDGDPGLGVWLVPIGALLLFYGIARMAIDLSKLK